MEREIKIDIVRCIKVIVSKWMWVALVSIVCAFAAYAMKYDAVQTYNAYTTIYSASYGSYSETAESMKAVQLYSEIITSKKIAERAMSIIGDAHLTVDDIRGMVYVNYSEDSPVLGIGAVSTESEMAVKVANAVADAFIIETFNITGGEGVQILDRATGADAIPLGKLRTCVLAFLAGFVLCVGVIVLKEIFSDRVYHVEDAELDGELEILGMIPKQTIES